MKLIYMPGDKVRALHDTQVVNGKPDEYIRLKKGETYTINRVDVGVNGTILYGLKEKEGYAYFEKNFEPPTFLDEDLFNV